MDDSEFLGLSQARAWEEYQRLVSLGMYRDAERRSRLWHNTKGIPLSAAEGDESRPIQVVPTRSHANQNEIGTSSIFGWVFLIAGLVLIAGSFIYQPTVETDYLSRLDGSAYSAPSDVYNFGKLNIQLMLCITGAAFLMSGSVLIRPKA